ncbi:hypothetical protein DYBT9623_00185 [Dyadobacter sp. CECT 9623]|uniref:Transposase n=1 Tax=Dyadobacter linearis TaxID=2823330 RepID=A0ABM8UJA8_9BACT|nr:hypothetical protein [Dyadobacter sp. CECT 9623]CAG5067464.1 hypothetical protein DYBT9623_00185 [Dyadobacter sp. CECT 9623]
MPRISSIRTIVSIVNQHIHQKLIEKSEELLSNTKLTISEVP